MSLLTRRVSRVLTVVLFSSLSAFAANPPQAIITVKQLPRSEFDVTQRGAVSIAYEMTIRNPSQHPITLQQITMKTAGRSPYLLKNEPVQLEQRIEAESEATITFSMWAYSRSSAPRKSRGMVWVRGTAQFESEGQTSVTKFSASFREPD